MSRSGYSDDCDNLNLYRGNVARVLKSKRGQAFLRELAEQMDAMPEKRLIESELVSRTGECCTLGVVCKSRQLDVRNIDETDSERVGQVLDISHIMAAEIAYMNDEYPWQPETPEQRWVRMRKWVAEQSGAVAPAPLDANDESSDGEFQTQPNRRRD